MTDASVLKAESWTCASSSWTSLSRPKKLLLRLFRTLAALARSRRGTAARNIPPRSCCITRFLRYKTALTKTAVAAAAAAAAAALVAQLANVGPGLGRLKLHQPAEKK